MGRRKILLIELNEITWELIDPFIAQGKLPTFAKLKEEGTWAAPLSVDMPPQLDPWITWTTVYTGRPQSDHNVFFLEQPHETIGAKRIWELCHEAGLRVGVYGSLCSWPPQQMNGFYVPDTFAPDAATYPASLRPIQEMNLTYTRGNRIGSSKDILSFKAWLAWKLLGFGLRLNTLGKIIAQLMAERQNPKVYWKRVALQPCINLDCFESLYRQYTPDFASFHTNHVAHYMHTYWKAMRPDVFPQSASSDEVETYGGAIEHGYRVADELLSRCLKIADSDTVLVVASSMGQQPYISSLKNGKPIRQFRSLDHLVRIIGLTGKVKALSTMSDQFNLYAEDNETRNLVMRHLRSAYVNTPQQAMFYVENVSNAVTVTMRPYEDLSESSRVVFPETGQSVSFPYADLVYSTGLVKSGWHDPKGMMILKGPGIRKGGTIANSNNLDIAPTLLSILGMPIPLEMKGCTLHEAFGP
jgi:hypothetical protein